MWKLFAEKSTITFQEAFNIGIRIESVSKKLLDSVIDKRLVTRKIMRPDFKAKFYCKTKVV